ncbi:hypothetical protein [Bacillus sp. REN3]|uniref:hypothetical protein n=1 Tax=Bacillus sp. REN3 TaxID=2802440 RepID=UPI001AEE0327|nr:hypothetical protein [Bacillus sp. REN3]
MAEEVLSWMIGPAFGGSGSDYNELLDNPLDRMNRFNMEEFSGLFVIDRWPVKEKAILESLAVNMSDNQVVSSHHTPSNYLLLI